MSSNSAAATLLLPLLLCGLGPLGGCVETRTRERKLSPLPESVLSADPRKFGAHCGDKKCDPAVGEDCSICEYDCGLCDGCQVMLGGNCADARCEACVCKKHPDCCGQDGKWGKKCVETCKQQCGGCGRRPGIENISTVTVCKDCDGCRVRTAGGCAGCKCEACVCKMLPSCCGVNGRWGEECVAACKACRGCGIHHSGDMVTDWNPGDRKRDEVGCLCHERKDQ